MMAFPALFFVMASVSFPIFTFSPTWRPSKAPAAVTVTSPVTDATTILEASITDTDFPAVKVARASVAAVPAVSVTPSEIFLNVFVVSPSILTAKSPVWETTVKVPAFVAVKGVVAPKVIDVVVVPVVVVNSTSESAVPVWENLTPFTVADEPVEARVTVFPAGTPVTVAFVDKPVTSPSNSTVPDPVTVIVSLTVAAVVSSFPAVPIWIALLVTDVKSIFP